MTCREKLKMEHPEWVDYEKYDGGCRLCPHHYDYLDRPDDCETISCGDCWDRGIPEENKFPLYPIDTEEEKNLAKDLHQLWPKENPHITEAMKKAKEFLGIIPTNVKDIREENGGITAVIEPVKQTRKYDPVKKAYCMLLDFVHHNKTTDLEEVIGYLGEALDDNPYVEEESSEPHIKDSGDRTQFETGAVRDMREGKGRCDLMPLEVVAEIVCEKLGRDPILYDISCFLDKDDEQGTAWLKAALDNFANKAYGGQRTTMFLEVAKHFEEGAKKYGENNWQKGIPVHCYIDSAVRHYLKWLRGDKDEPHDRAFVWNLMCCIWEVDYRPKEGEANA